MNEVGQRLKLFLALLLLVTATGTIAFVFLEDLSFSESLYYNIVTMSTVGYGDIHPTSQASRLVTVLIIFMGGVSFIGVIANTTELLILRRETSSRERKVNMLLGVFFSEVGYYLLEVFASNDRTIDSIRRHLLININWTASQFSAAKKALGAHSFNVDIDEIELGTLESNLSDKRDFMVGLLENPVLIEHEAFSDALLAVFHLLDELRSRDGFESLPASDKQHLGGDIDRAYACLVGQWVYYLKHLKGQYPYLFSLAIRKNPFDPAATPIVSA